jgi:hypothetical protein
MLLPKPLPRLQTDPTDAPGAIITELLRKCPPGEFSRAKTIASSIRDPSYSLKAFYGDIQAAFPEVRLYFIEAANTKQGRRSSDVGFERHDTSSGISSAQEYLRTVGAFFAVYWLMRIGVDGERGFSFGVDEDTWVPLTREQVSDGMSATDTKGSGKKNAIRSRMDPQAAFFSMGPTERALAFHMNTQWDKLNAMLCDAGLLVKKAYGFEVVVERVVALLALTAIHDIMKIDMLLPTVQPQHAPYEGFAEGDKINDHDVALGYIFEHYSECLPSFCALGKSMQKTVRFTQTKLGFNHGWLVQAEAAPGPLFSTFKRVLSSKSDRVEESDVSFYFVHWVTDLAGAEPTPLRGSEKFVLKFPHPVLHSFISSFSLVGTLVDSSETAVYEKFLLQCWTGSQKELGAPPRGKHAIALMRLVVQVQHLPLQHRLLDAFSKLGKDDVEVLCREMSLTGCKGQDYESHPTVQGGPVFLVYYSPAFLRVATRSDALAGLRMLAEVYRQARTLWPFDSDKHTEHVTIRIDQIKEHTPQHVMEGHLWGEGWLLVKHNDREAIVEHHPLYTLNQNSSGLLAKAYRILGFWQLTDDDDDELISELEELRRQRMRPTAGGARPKSTQLEA